MNGKQRIEAALLGEWPDKRPVMLHNFLMAIEESEYNHQQFREDPEIASRIFIQATEKYNPDGILIDFDTATLAGAVGVEVDFPENDAARCHGQYLTDLAMVEELPEPDIKKDERIQVWIETVRIIKKYFGDEKYIRGNCDQAPFSLASMMRTPSEWMLDILMDQPAVYRLLDYCTETGCQFIELMAETGADMVSNGDSPAGPEMISPDQYLKYALPYEKILADKAGELGLPHLLHICGNTDIILEHMIETGSKVVELDYKTDTRLVYKYCVPNKVLLCGNLDPTGVIAHGNPDLVEQKAIELLEIYRDSPLFIMNAGCAIPAGTPPENIRKLIEVTRNY
jgi:uroporphyrinogen decarboxylase